MATSPPLPGGMAQRRFLYSPYLPRRHGQLTGKRVGQGASGESGSLEKRSAWRCGSGVMIQLFPRAHAHGPCSSEDDAAAGFCNVYNTPANRSVPAKAGHKEPSVALPSAAAARAGRLA